MVTSSNDVIDYCPYELAAKQLKELMEESLKAKSKQVNAFSKFSTKEFSDKEWNNYCDDPSGRITPGDENLEQQLQQQKSKEITGMFHLSSAMHRSNWSRSRWYKYESSLSPEFEKCTIYVTFRESRD